MTSRRLPTYAIPHGGGPWPWIKHLMPWSMATLEDGLAAIPAEVGATPAAVLVVTAHWETPVFTVQGNPTPPMLYDYGGFPPETYEIQYPAPGDPALADRVTRLLTDAGIANARDDARGFDHGTFVPMYVMFPEANVPIVQLSILRSFDPDQHLAAGRALAPLRDEGVLIVASGLPSYHDLSRMGPASATPSEVFDQWLTDTVINSSGTARSRRLAHWDQAPAARQAHPREDHFIPLLVAAGAAESEAGVRTYHEPRIPGRDTTSSGYRFGRVAN